MDGITSGSISGGFDGGCGPSQPGFLRLLPVGWAGHVAGSHEAEAGDSLGRPSYERRASDRSAYRNSFKRGRVTTGEGAIELFVPQSRDGPEPFQTAIPEAFQRRCEVLEANSASRASAGGTSATSSSRSWRTKGSRRPQPAWGSSGRWSSEAGGRSACCWTSSVQPAGSIGCGPWSIAVRCGRLGAKKPARTRPISAPAGRRATS